MRTRIDYGVDLGTTNSAIARIENGKPVIKKSDTLKDTTPSCVTVNKKKDILVGDPALNSLKNDKIRALKTGKQESSNSYIEFKRTMGTTTKYHSSNMEKDFTSEELSAEILRKLKSYITDDALKAIVITVPAKFTMVQKDATVRAGKMAGFKHVELLQEPIAASMAYGLDAKNKDGVWLVFDFGGGTFDAAIVRIEEGIMKVIDTEGDNWLGGKNLDEAIVDQILIPHLQEHFSLENTLSNIATKEVLRNAVKYYADECKVQLSYKEKHTILTDLGDLPFEDEDGEELSLDMEVDQLMIEKVFSPIFQKAIDICKDLLKRNNLSHQQLSTLILVGGPTYSPILRRMLKEQITTNINTSIDPMTSVAVGASLFASTVSISEEVIEESRDKTKIQLEIKHEPTSVEAEEMVNIKILKDKTQGSLPEKVFAEIVRGDLAWSSGKKSLSEKATLFDIVLNMGASNSFTINLYDEEGDKLECQPNSFNVLQGINPGQATLPYHMGIEIKDRLLGEDVFLPLQGLAKNLPIPATGVIRGLKTQRPIRPGVKDDTIVIPLYQGEYSAEGSRAINNDHINDVIITGESLPSILPEGSEVEITVKVDRSEKMTLSAFFPYLNHTEEIKVEYIQREQVDENWLRSEIITAKKNVQKLQNGSELAALESIKGKLETLEQQLENEKASADGKFRILDNLRVELRHLDSIRHEAEFPQLEKKLKATFYALEELIDEIKADDEKNLNIEKVEAHLEEYRVKIEHVIKTKDIREARELLEAMGSTEFAIRDAASGGMMDVALLKYISDDFSRIKWKDPNKARNLLNQAINAINNGKMNNLRPFLSQIIDVMDRSDAEEFLGKLTR